MNDTDKALLRAAIQALGAPVMSYVPEIAMEEYDRKIKIATDMLLYVLNRNA